MKDSNSAKSTKKVTEIVSDASFDNNKDTNTVISVREPEELNYSSVPELKKGDSFKFGNYYQDDFSSKTPIEWLVLEKSDSKVLLISRYSLDVKQYHHEYVRISWKDCDLRKWLNGEFLQSAFSEEDRKAIELTKLETDKKNTKDRIFCLSIDEVENLFDGSEDGRCVPVSNIREKLKSSICKWWLRSRETGLGLCHAYAFCAPSNSRGVNTVRPTLWVNLDLLRRSNNIAKTEQIKDTDTRWKEVWPPLEENSYFKFGSYCQDDSGKKTPIEWLVLKKSDSKVLLISRYCLDFRQYYHESEEITWSNSDLRKWLNDEFLRTAFSDEEQKKIAVTKLANDNNPDFDTTDGGSKPWGGEYAPMIGFSV